MAFADVDAYVAAARRNRVADFQMSANAGFAAGRLGNLSRQFLPAPALPTASVALDNTSDRAINGVVPNAGGGRQSILGGRINTSGLGGVVLMLVDMLTISGGLDATVTTAQTTNLPTAALPRYTSGVGVHAALVIHSQLGGTATTATVSYTNQANTAGRTSTAMNIGATGFREVGALLRIPLEAGDTGVRSVESVTLAATTSSAGNFGVVLYRPLAMLICNDVEGAHVHDCISSARMIGQCAEVLDDACLSLFAIMPVAQGASGAILLGEA